MSRFQRDLSVAWVGILRTWVVNALFVMQNLVSGKHFTLFPSSLLRCVHWSYENFVFVDPNCIQILAPTETRPDKGDNFVPGQHMGHISKDCVSVLAPLMDDGFRCVSDEGDDYAYHSGFVVVCILSSNSSNRSAAGYPVDIVFYSNNSTKWVQCLAECLRSSNFVPVILKWYVHKIPKTFSLNKKHFWCLSVGYDKRICFFYYLKISFLFILSHWN